MWLIIEGFLGSIASNEMSWRAGRNRERCRRVMFSERD